MAILRGFLPLADLGEQILGHLPGLPGSELAVLTEG